MDHKVLDSIIWQMTNFKDDFHPVKKAETMVFYGNFDPTARVLPLSLSEIYPLIKKNNDFHNLCFNCRRRTAL